MFKWFRRVFIGASVGLILLFTFVSNPFGWLTSCDGPFVQCALLPVTPVYLFTERSKDQGNRRTGIITEEWQYCDDRNGKVFEIPAGFNTDFASIPWIGRVYANPTSDYIIEAAIVHDWLYAMGTSGDEAGRKHADGVFRQILKESGVNVLRRNILHRAVRMGGSGGYGQSDELRLRMPPVSGKLTGLTLKELFELPVRLGNQDEFTAQIDELPRCEGFHDKYWGSDTWRSLRRGPSGSN